MTNHNSPLARWTASKHSTDSASNPVEQTPGKRKFISPLNLFARPPQAIPPAAQTSGLDENDTVDIRDDEPSLSDLMSQINPPATPADTPASDAGDDTVDLASDLQFVELDDDLEMHPVDADVLANVTEQAEKTIAAEEESWTSGSDEDATPEEPSGLADAVAPAAKAESAPAVEAVVPATPAVTPEIETTQDVPAPVAATPPRARSSSRVKTTFLGFEHSDGRIEDVFDRARESVSAERVKFPVGWMVIVDGPGRGTSFTLLTGVSQIGRGDDQAVQLDFGDNGISRSNHAAVAYDDEERKFYLGHGGKSNIVRLNGKPVLSTEPLEDGDQIRIGETTLNFVAFCGTHFTWSAKN